jgi:hypothetical protein
MTFTTIEACDLALTAWRRHLAEFPSNPSYLFVCGYIKRLKKKLEAEDARSDH